jgi:hypothetical protein
MNELAHKERADAAQDGHPDVETLIDALRTKNADRFDPVRWHYIEALSRRAATHQGSIRRSLDARLAQALTAYQERLDRAQSDAGELVARSVQQYPQASKDLQRHFDAGDFHALRRLAATLKSNEPCATLSALVRQLEQTPADSAKTHVQVPAASRPELKVIRESRNTWSKLSVDKQVAQALGQAPKNAGPINSHMLMLRSLALMREISPDYLNRFMTYADTLLCLDQCEKDKPSAPPKKPAAKTSKK